MGYLNQHHMLSAFITIDWSVPFPGDGPPYEPTFLGFILVVYGLGAAAGLVVAIVKLFDTDYAFEGFEYFGRLFCVFTWPVATLLLGIARMYNEAAERRVARQTKTLQDEIWELNWQLRIKEDERQAVIEAAEEKNEYLQKRLQEVLYQDKDSKEGGYG